MSSQNKKHTLILFSAIDPCGISFSQRNDVECPYLDTIQSLNKWVSGVLFDSIMVKCDSVEEINRLAFDSRDFIGALKLFYDETDKSNVDMSSVDAMIVQIDLEFENERYEKVEELVDVAYEEIIDIQSTSSALKVFYSSTSSRVVSFLKEHYRKIVFILLLSLFLYFIFRKNIKIKINRVRIHDRELRKEVIKDLIRKTQKEYFSSGKISEGMYSVRTKKFSQIVRGLDKEILEFKENLLNLGVKK